MFDIFATRLRQGDRTVAYPREPPTLPDRFRGRPELKPSRCPDSCRACVQACPTQALDREHGLSLDLGRCVFCTTCTELCTDGGMVFTSDHRLSMGARQDLVVRGEGRQPMTALSQKITKHFGRSLAIRVVSAGGCNACEADINVLSTILFDLGRFGIHVVASPRHADALMVVGPVTGHMHDAVLATYEAMPDPRIVVAVGACAISGGLFAGLPEVHDGVADLLPVDVFVPGCPPHPYTILDGLLRSLGRITD